MSRIINQNTEPLFIFDMPDDHLLSETISVKGEKGERGDPTKLSDLENDEGFITVNTDELANYYTKTATDNLLNTKLDKTTFNAYEIPSDFFTADETVSGTGTSISLVGTAATSLKDITIYGNTSQNGTPTPTSPIAVKTVTGVQTISITGDGSQDIVIDLGSLELCKIGSYQDYIYKDGDSWYLHKETTSVTLNGSETWYIWNGNLYIESITDYNRTSNVPFCSVYKGTAMTAGTLTPTAANDKTIRFGNNANLVNRLFIIDSNFANVADFKAWLSTNNLKVYYALAASADIAITDGSLITQLNALLSARAYDGSTSITTSGDLAASLTVEAFKNGWSGTVNGLIDDIDDLSKRPATPSALGLVKVGDGLDVSTDGELSVTPDKKIHFHSIAASSATYILQMPNGKNMIIDSGTSAQWSDIKDAIDSLGITKFDYAITTHFHPDHYGNNQNLINTYDFSDCTWWVGMKPDYTNHAAQIPEDTEAGYDNQITLLTSNGITPIVPTNNSTVVLDADNGVTVRFLNTDPAIAENYYTRYTEYRTYQGVNFNDFSLIAEITYGDVKILATGDIERPVEDAYATYLGKIDIMTAPHHGVNQDANRAFYYATKPDYAICAYVTDSDTWVHPWYRSFAYLKEFGAKIISAHMSQPVDGLFSFTSDGKTVSTTALYSAISDDVFNYGKQCVNIADLVRATIDSKATITLVQLLANLPEGSRLRTMWWSSYNTSYPQVYADLQAIFPTFKANMMVEFRKDQSIYELKAYNNLISFEAYSETGTINWHISGHGNVGSIASKEALLTLLPRLPFGQYVCAFYNEPDSEILQTDGAYALHIDIVEKDTKTSGIITAQIRDLGSATTNYVVSAQTYYRSDRSPYIFWRRTNNLVQ